MLGRTGEPMSARPHGGVTSTVKPPPLPSAARPAAHGSATATPSVERPAAGTAKPKPPARPPLPAQAVRSPARSLVVPRGPTASVPELWQDADEAQWLLKLAKARVAADAEASAAAASEEAEWRAALARAHARDGAREPELAHTTSTVRAIPPPPEAELDWDAMLQAARARSAHDEAKGLLQPKAPQPARPPKPRRPAQSGSFPTVAEATEGPGHAASVRRLPPPVPRRSSAAGASADPFAPLVPFTPPARAAQVVSWPPVALKAG